MGDGVLIYFGYPQAHEDASTGSARSTQREATPDAERAVRAGLDAELGMTTSRP